MSDKGSDKAVVNAFQHAVEACGEGRCAVTERVGHTIEKNEVTICEIITFSPLYLRNPATIYPRLTGASALVLEFPAPRWQRNASARR